MSIPDFQSLMLPLLKLLADEQEYSIHEIIETLAWEFSLTDVQKKELLPSGQQSVFDNRVHWARTYLKKAGIVESPRRAFVKITDRGVEVLQQKPKAINTKFLLQYPEFVEFQNTSRPAKLDWTTNEDWDEDLEEDLEDESDEDLEDESDLDDELDSDLEMYQFSARFCTMKKELLKLVTSKDGTQHILLVEGEDNDIVITYLFREQKLISIWNRSTALAIAEAIQWYYEC